MTQVPNMDEIERSFPNPAKSRFYEIYIQPFLTETPYPTTEGFFAAQAHKAWRLGVNPVALDRLAFFLRFSEDLLKTDGEQLKDAVTATFEEQHDANVRRGIAEDEFHEAKVDGTPEEFFGKGLNLYKVLFESAFRLWSSMAYMFVCAKHGIPHKVPDGAAFIKVAASEKYRALKERQLVVLGGVFADFTKGFDNVIRNLGAGHDRWEVTDDGKLLLDNLDDKTGQPKTPAKITLTKDELTSLIQECKRNLWVLEVGFAIFLNNHPELTNAIQRQKPFKINEIKGVIGHFAEERMLVLEEFMVDQRAKTISLKIRPVKQVEPIESKVFFGTAEAYDVIHIKQKVRLDYQVYDVLIALSRVMDVEDYEQVRISIVEEGQETSSAVFLVEELKPVFQEPSKTNIPVPSEGGIPPTEMTMLLPIRVPMGLLDEKEKEAWKRNLSNKLTDYKPMIHDADDADSTDSKILT